MIIVRINSSGLTINEQPIAHCQKVTSDEKFLEILMLRNGWVTKSELMDWIYGDHPDPPYDHILTVLCNRVRDKIKKYNIEIETQYCVGYRIKNKPIVKVCK